jgi:hypothetical protein
MGGRWCLGWIMGVAVGLAGSGLGQIVQGQGSAADYERMESVGQLGNSLVDRTQLRCHWLSDRDAMWYEVVTGPQSSEYYLVDLRTGAKSLVLTSQQFGQWRMAGGAQADAPPGDYQQLELIFDDSLALVYIPWRDERYRLDRRSGEWQTVSAEEFPELPVAQAVDLKVSGSSDERVSLRFRNQLESAVELIWIDSRGAPRSYGTVEAGQVNDMSTYRSHVWLVRDRDGLNLKMVEARFDGQEVAVDSGAGVVIRVPRAARRHADFYQQGNPAAEGTPEERTAESSMAAGDGAVQPARARRRSPDERWEVDVQGSGLVLKDVASQQERVMESEIAADHFFNGQFFWSPDSNYLVAMLEQPPQTRDVYLIESSPRDQLQPQLHSFDYLKPGDQIRQVKPRLFDIRRGCEVAISDDWFANPWGLHEFRWAADSSEFSFRYNQRGHQVMRIVGIRNDGSTRVIVAEESDTFIDYTGKFHVDYLDETGEIVWASQRDGWNHLYLYDRSTGQVKQQITQGPWVVREVQEVDRANRRIWFTAGGIYPDQDPYQLHYCHVDFSGRDLVVMTAGDGNHRIEYSPDRRYLIARYSRVDLPPVHEIREVATGRLVCELERGDWSRLLSAGWRPPQRFSAAGRDGQTEIFGVIYRPSNFDPQRQYPVIEYIYAGPQGAFVPKDFGPSRWEKSLAELGFIVVQIDGMGTNYRSKAFHDVCWKNLGDGGFPDRILWLQAAARQEPAMDLNRVGIFGGSAGGQNAARAVLAFGEHYHVAVADCGCHDNRMDKIWWNEQWMGWPIEDHYAEQSNVTQAANLQGKLFLIVGELDRNVDPASTMQVVDALIRANKDFDLLVVPGGGHGIGSSPYGRRRTADFFVRHLWKTEPRH